MRAKNLALFREASTRVTRARFYGILHEIKMTGTKVVNNTKIRMKIQNASLPRWVTRRDPLFRPESDDEERFMIEEKNDIENGI